MNRFNKGKLTGIIAASLSAVSLMGVGFATWIIGVQKTDGDTSISILLAEIGLVLGISSKRKSG